MAIKTMYIPWALWLSRSLKHFWEQNFLLLLAKKEGWRFTLRGS